MRDRTFGQIIKTLATVVGMVGWSIFGGSIATAQNGRLDQYCAEIGLQGGGAFYLGEANPSTPWHTPREDVGGFVRYNINPHYTLKLSASHNRVVGDTRDFKNRFPGDKQCAFERKFMDVSLRGEFNFFPYGLPRYNREYKWFTPYIFVGAGITAYNDKYKDEKRMTFSMPFGVGMKFKFAERFNVGWEWSLHTLFIDDFDVTSEESEILNNPYGHPSSKLKNKDKYSIGMIYISIDILKRGFCRR